MPRKFSTPYKLAAAAYEAMIKFYTRKPRAWLQGAMMKTNGKGEPIGYCLLGGLSYNLDKLLPESPYRHTTDHKPAYDIVNRQLGTDRGILAFNDNPETKRKDVLVVLKSSLEEANILHKNALKVARLQKKVVKPARQKV